MAVVSHKNFLEVVHACDDFPYDAAAEQYYQLFLPNDHQPHGYMLPDVVEKMPWTSHFEVQHLMPRKVIVLDSSHGTQTAHAINEAFQILVDICIERDLFHILCARHSEMFAIVGARYAEPVQVERFAAPLFGFTSRGVHLIAYTNTPEGIKIWVSRRASNLYIWPGKLDSTVGGGIKAGVSPFQTVIEEAEEEASLSSNLIQSHARSCGAVTHMGVTGAGFPGEKGLVTPDYIYVYDLELPEDIMPAPCDDEVSAFYPMAADEVKKALLNGKFKPDSAAVFVDFLVRHSYITPENEKHFVDITMRLHRRLPFRIE